jgi:hypothetical protein
MNDVTPTGVELVTIEQELRLAAAAVVACYLSGARSKWPADGTPWVVEMGSDEKDDEIEDLFQ